MIAEDNFSVCAKVALNFTKINKMIISSPSRGMKDLTMDRKRL